MTDVPRLRMFAGPNGSGKTTIKNDLRKSPEWFGIYINPDEIEKTLRETGVLALEPYGVALTTDEVQAWCRASPLLLRQGLQETGFTSQNNCLESNGTTINSYHAAALADMLRRQALQLGLSFSFETVMSEPSKVQLLCDAQQRGYRTYLYYVATETPAINVARVQNRVAEGGHDVPDDKIRARYTRSLELLIDAISCTNRAYFFDTSEAQSRWIAEITNATELDPKTASIPNWFKTYVWDKLQLEEEDEAP